MTGPSPRSLNKRMLRVWWHKVYPWTGLRGLDRRMVRVIGAYRNGVFIEAGANDGVRQSNTYFLARRRGWSGLLVEAVPRLADECRRNRPEAIVENCALVARHRAGGTVELVDVDLMTTVVDDGQDHEDRIAEAERVQGIARARVSVTGVTLSSLVEKHGLARIDLLSLDVEGFELDVLDGLDLDRHRPRWILVETAQLDAVRKVLETRYVLEALLSHHDYLFRFDAEE